jgi:hypothetical protein
LNQGGFFYLNQVHQTDLQTIQSQWLGWQEVGLEEIHAPLWLDYVSALKNSLVYPTDQEDSLIWYVNPVEGYAPKHGYSALIQENIVASPLWWGITPRKKKFPTKSKLFIWLLLLNKFPTWENLQKINFVGPSRCPLCK